MMDFATCIVLVVTLGAALALEKERVQCNDPATLPSLTDYKYETLPGNGIRASLSFSSPHQLEASWFLRNLTGRSMRVTDFFIVPTDDTHYSAATSRTGNSTRFTLTGENLVLEKIKKRIRFRLIVRHPCNVIYVQSRLLTWQWIHSNNFTMPILTKIPKPTYKISGEGKTLTLAANLESKITKPELLTSFLYGFSKYARFDSEYGMVPMSPIQNFFKYERENINYHKLFVDDRKDKYIFNNNVTFSPWTDDDAGVYYTTLALNLLTDSEYWLARLKIIMFSDLKGDSTPKVSMRVYSKRAGEFDPLPTESGGNTMVPLPRTSPYGFPHSVQCMVDAETHPIVTVLRQTTSDPGDEGVELVPAKVFDSATFVERSYTLQHVADDSFYTCIADAGGERLEKRFKVALYDPVKITSHTSRTYYRIDEVKNKNLGLNCMAEGNPTPDITWYMNAAYGEPGEVIYPGKRDFLIKNQAHQLNRTDSYLIFEGRRMTGKKRSWLTIKKWDHLINKGDVTREVICYAYNDYSFATQTFRFS